MIDTVIFDWGGTLTPWQPGGHVAPWRALADVVDPVGAQELAGRLQAAEDARWRRVRDEHRAFRIEDVLADAGVAASDEALAAYWAQWHFPLDAEAAPMLAELRERGLRLGVLSSTSWPRAWHEELLQRDRVLHLFDACVWSSELPWTKPHPSAFMAAMAAVGAADPARCVYVGDRPYDDISGAKGVGMRAVLVPHSDIPEHQQVPVDVHPDGVVQRLSELPGLIAGW